LLLLNAGVGFIQEFQAGSIVDELKKTLALKATVLRAGQLYEVEAHEVVPGDIIQIEEVAIYMPLASFIHSDNLGRELLFLPMVALLPTKRFCRSTNPR
jgi:hypothetical protein